MGPTKTIFKTTKAGVALTYGGTKGVWRKLGDVLTAEPGTALHKAQHATFNENSNLADEYMYEKTGIAVESVSTGITSLKDAFSSVDTKPKTTIKNGGLGGFGK